MLTYPNIALHTGLLFSSPFAHGGYHSRPPPAWKGQVQGAGPRPPGQRVGCKRMPCSGSDPPSGTPGGRSWYRPRPFVHNLSIDPLSGSRRVPCEPHAAAHKSPPLLYICTQSPRLTPRGLHGSPRHSFPTPPSLFPILSFEMPLFRVIYPAAQDCALRRFSSSPSPLG